MNITRVAHRYPYARAVKVEQQIRKLRVFKDGSTFLDKVRVLITQIGNALGFVRIVRSAGMHYCGNAAKFVTELKEEAAFGTWAGAGLPADATEDGDEAKCPSEGARLPEVTVEAAKALDGVVRGLQSSFGVINSTGGGDEANDESGSKGSASGSVCTDYFEVLGESFLPLLCYVFYVARTTGKVRGALDTLRT